MTNNDELALKLKEAAEKATSLNLDSAEIQRGNDGYYECPVCCGEGEVEAKSDFCNIDGVALGVQFYGVGEHHGAAEEYFRAASPANILALLAERDAKDKRIAEQQEHISSLEEGANMLLAQYDRLASAMGWTTEKALAGYGNQEQYAEAMVKRIAELEARKVSLDLPGNEVGKAKEFLDDVVVVPICVVEECSAAAGIKLDVGE